MSATEMQSLPFPFPTVGYRDATVVLIDQTRLPAALVWRECHDIPSLCHAIKELAVRGAPAIGIAAAYGMVLAWERIMRTGEDTQAVLASVDRERELLAATRPTAVNLFWALARMDATARDSVRCGDTPDAVLAALKAEADEILAEDLAMCRTLGAAGAALLPAEATVLTHCNAGGLATGGYGTALGVVYAAREAGKQIRVFADETRPLLQGARLTAWELTNQGIEVTLLCEGAAATVLRRGWVDAVVTGADRIASNGDAANKIGTYPLAVLAQKHGVPFFIAAPAPTFDPDAPTGEQIVVEERAAAEVCQCGGHQVAPHGVAAFNPAFDVTPAELITAFITEYGVLRPPYGESLRPVLARGES